MGLPTMIETWAIESRPVAHVVTCGVGLFVVPSFHPATGQLQVLAAMMVYVM
jgi:hypothetical protein